MKRTLITAVVLLAVAAFPATASAAGSTWKGIVVAKDPQRNAVVTASAGGLVRTLRVSPARTRALRVGQRLDVKAVALADGTFRASSARVTGRASKARIRAVVVRYQRELSRYLVSAGGTVFPIAYRHARKLSSSHEPKPGDQVVATVTVPQTGAIQSTTVITVGRVASVELEGILTKVSATSLELLVARKGFVTIVVPAGFTLPATLKQFDEVELVVAIGTDGSFTLVGLQDDEGEDEDGEGIDLDGDELEVEGTVTAIGAGSITVQPGRTATPVTCTIPAGLTVPVVKLGDRVEIECRIVAPNQFVLKKLEREDDDEEDEDEDEDDDDTTDDDDDTDDEEDDD